MTPPTAWRGDPDPDAPADSAPDDLDMPLGWDGDQA